VVPLGLVLSAGTARAAPVDWLALSGTVDGAAIGDGRLVLEPAQATRVAVKLQNLTSSSVEVGSMRLSGTVLGVTFFDYDTQVRTIVPARGSANWTVDLDTRGLASRATGLVPFALDARGTDRETLATVSGTADVRGSLVSAYGLFGLGLVILTSLLTAVALLPLGRHAAPAEPWLRGLRFVPAGAGAGLVAVFGLSVLKLTVPSAPTDVGIALGAAAIAFGIGCLLPPADAAQPASAAPRR
jgi:hypothetical protein